jgi:hypothetical protein
MNFTREDFRTAIKAAYYRATYSPGHNLWDMVTDDLIMFLRVQDTVEKEARPADASAGRSFG